MAEKTNDVEIIEEREEITTENSESMTLHKDEPSESQDRLIKLPISRVKHIMKTDPDVTILSQDAVITVAKATELFIQSLAKDAAAHTMKGNRKTLMRKDLDNILDIKDCYAFLEGALDS